MHTIDNTYVLFDEFEDFGQDQLKPLVRRSGRGAGGLSKSNSSTYKKELKPSSSGLSKPSGNVIRPDNASPSRKTLLGVHMGMERA
jgi:hypothetical protein